MALVSSMLPLEARAPPIIIWKAIYKTRALVKAMFEIMATCNWVRRIGLLGPMGESQPQARGSTPEWISIGGKLRLLQQKAKHLI